MNWRFCSPWTLDAIAAQSDSGDLLISMVHRGATGPVHLTIHVEGISARANATVSTLSGVAPWAANTLENPETIRIVETASELRAGSLPLPIQPFSVVQVRLAVPTVPLKPDH